MKVEIDLHDGRTIEDTQVTRIAEERDTYTVHGTGTILAVVTKGYVKNLVTEESSN